VSFMARPPFGAAPINETDPVDRSPPYTVTGLMVMSASKAGTTVRVAASETPPAVTVIVAVTVEAPGVV